MAGHALDDIGIVYLVGFMGSGKTTVGRRLAELLGWQFVDLDAEIEARAGAPIRDLFRDRGEPHFRRLEREELGKVSARRHVVAALGGGAFCSSQNQAIVRTTGRSVWLDAPAEVLYARCSGDEARPLFTTREAMEALLDERRAMYEQADLRVDVSALSFDEVARRILAALEAKSL